MPKNEYTVGTVQQTTTKQQFAGPGGPGGRGGSGEKAQNFTGTWAKLIRYCKPYLPAVVVALLLSCVGSVLNLVGPNQLSKITDMITAGLMGSIDLAAIGRLALLLAVLYGLGFLFSYGQSLIMAVITQKVSKGLRGDISTKINRLPLHYFDRNSYGDVLSRVTNDVDTIGQTLNQSIGSLVSAATMFVGSFIMMLSVNWVMTLTAVVAVVIGFVFMMLIISRSQKYFDRQQQELGVVNGHIEEIYAGHTVVRAYNGEEDARGRFHSINDRLYDSAWKSQFLSGTMPTLMSFVGNLGYVAVCIAGAVLALNGQITFGVIVAFMLYIRLFTQPLSQLGQAATTLQSAAAASERVFDFLDEKELSDESGKAGQLPVIKGNVSFEKVTFCYDGETPVIQNFSAKAKAGQKIAIVGPTGAGKTTLVNLLMRFYELDGGAITMEGVPISNMTRAQVHSQFGMVLQDTWLFQGTIRENIVFNTPNVTEEQLASACKAAGIHHFITTLPQGYDTVLNDSANLSAGQKQLVTIARAMVKNAPMLILDEATSSVDTRTELLLQQAMDRLMAGRTSFVIAHRLSTIKNSDLILVMKDGGIVESGTHEELLRKQGAYAELYNSQFAA